MGTKNHNLMQKGKRRFQPRYKDGLLSAIITILLVIFLFISLSTNISTVSASKSIGVPDILLKPEIKGYSVTPSSGTPDEEIVFLVKYQEDDNTPPEYVRVVIDDDRHDLRALNPEDEDYMDGKDYFTRLKLSEGTHIYYFEVSNGSHSTSTSAATIRIKPQEDFTHLDVTYSILLATIVFLIPIVYGTYQLRKMTKIISRTMSMKHEKNVEPNREEKKKG